MQQLRLTTIQADLHWEDKAANLQHLEELMDSIEMGEVIILPEMFSTGFTMNPEPFAEEPNGQTFEWLKSHAAQHQAAISGSYIVRAEDGTFRNRLLWMQPNGTVAYYDKKHLFTLAKEHKAYQAGEHRLQLAYKGWQICPMVCYDLRFPIWTRNLPPHYDLLYFVANWPQRRSAHWQALLVARAIENQAYVVGVNRVGEDGNGYPHQGDTMVIAPDGAVLYHLQNQEAAATHTLSLDFLRELRTALPFLADADSLLPETTYID